MPSNAARFELAGQYVPLLNPEKFQLPDFCISRVFNEFIHQQLMCI
jgi:hypothetical protein